jgi:FAD/FMN-containing dehydrogenase/Fe-S oxidoreductase
MPLNADFVNELRRHFSGDIRNDLASRILYSTDASIYQIEPLGVVIPRTQDDLQAVVELAARYRLPILPRGSGTSLAGQAVGEALVIDCSRWLDSLVALDPEARTATVEPGVILSHLNSAAAKFGLQYGPDPASAERASMGGVIANNATGAHSIMYGMTADHLLSADVVMADGTLATLGEQSIPESGHGVRTPSLVSAFYDAALEIRRDHSDAIKARYPRSWRNSAGYRLNYLLPWSATRPPQWDRSSYPSVANGTINLATLLAGSEGTLAVIQRATVNLVVKPAHTVLGILTYASIAAACDAVPGILERGPSAVELIPSMVLRLARGVPSHAARMSWLDGDPDAILVVEFSGDRLPGLIEQARRLRHDVAVAASPEQQAELWDFRRVGLGILDSRPQSARSCTFIEDCAIPVERLGEFVRDIESILLEHHTQGGIYAHASAGCLHVRPILDLKSRDGFASLHRIAEQVLSLTLRLGGAMSSEHGDGIARGEWLRETYGDELIDAMRSLKQAADPLGLLNPGKMIDAPRMDEHLRYGPAYKAHAWTPSLDFTRSGGLAIAIEQCNGQGVCRKDTGVMCPSFQATREETHSTRGRANLLRYLLTSGTNVGRPAAWDAMPEQAAFDALDLCLACKGCKAECPSGVDMARLKFEFLAKYYRSHPRPIRDYLFGYFHVTGRMLSSLAPIVNFATAVPFVRSAAARALHITSDRPFPKFSRPRFRPVLKRRRPQVIYLPDSFTHYVEPHVEQATFDLLNLAGYDVQSLTTMAAGAALLSKGFILGARTQASALINELRRLDPEGDLPVVGVEPSEVYALKEEYSGLVPEHRDEILDISSRTWLLDEFLVRSGSLAKLRVATTPNQVFFHPHCHQRAETASRDSLPIGDKASQELLKACGYDVVLSDAGCCGMAGTFGYEGEHYALSQQIGSMRLYPAIKQAAGMPVAATGAACRMQIAQGTGRRAEHPVVMARDALLKG